MYDTYEEEDNEPTDYFHLTHNPQYEYEGRFGDDDDSSDCYMRGMHITKVESY